MTREILEFDGVFCERCVGRIAQAVAPVDGVLAASANLAGEISLAYDDPAARAAVVAAVEAAGFTLTGSRPVAA